VQRVIAGFDAADPYSRRAPFPHLRRGPAPPGARIAVGDVAALCDAGTAALTAGAARALGAETIDVAEFLAVARLLYDGPWVAERSAALRAVIETRPDILHPVTRAILDSGLTRRAIDAF